MQITETKVGQSILDPQGIEYRVTAVNPRLDPHILADALTPADFNGALRASFCFSEKALRAFKAK